MKTHAEIEDFLPLYAAGRGSAAQRSEIERHLAGCDACRADLELWARVSLEIKTSDRRVAAPAGLAARALAEARGPSGEASSLAKTAYKAWQLLQAQARLVQREMWPASAVVMLLGAIVALLSKHVEAVYFISPLVAAASLSILFGPAYDPAYELTLSTPTSPWRLLLARLSLVSLYNLVLALAAGLILLAIVPSNLFGALVLGWLGPMAFLSALALLLSLWIGTGNAISLAYFLWILQFLPYRYLTVLLGSPAVEPFFQAYQAFWQSPFLLVSLSALLIVFALASARRPLFHLQQEPG